MALQPLTQGVELPAQFGEMLADASAGLSRRENKPAQVSEDIPVLEQDIEASAQLVTVIEEYFGFVRQAGQDDDAARKIVEWTDELDRDLAEIFNSYEEKLFPALKERAAILSRVIEGWHHLADASLIEPDLPPHLAERVEQLDTRISELTEEVTKKYDNDLVARLLMRVGKQRQLTLDEQFRLVDAVRLDWKVKEQPSLRRADWYGADGQ